MCVYVYIYMYVCIYIYIYIYIMEYYLAINKDKILPFVITWMDLEGIFQSEINQEEW